MKWKIYRESRTPILRHVHQEIQKDLDELISAANNAIQKIDIMAGNPKNDNVKDKLDEIRDILMKALPYNNKLRAKGIKMESTKMDESMNWNGVTDKFIDNDNIQFTRKCPSCGKPHSITVPIRDVEDGCSAYGKGARMQDAFPNFSPDEREFFMSGICPDCWENM